MLNQDVHKSQVEPGSSEKFTGSISISYFQGELMLNRNARPRLRESESTIPPAEP